MGKLNIEGVELTLDLTDIDTLASFEKCMNEVTRKVQDKEAYKGKSTAESLKYQCTLVAETFDALFGEGTSDKIFAGEEKNLFAHLKAFSDLVEAGRESAKKIRSVTTPWMPADHKTSKSKMKKKKKKSKGKKK